MLDLYDELRAVTSALDAAGISYAIIGGVAVSIYATPRTTEDMDLLVGSGDIGRIPSVLSPLGYRELGRPLRLVQSHIEIRRLTKLEGDDFMTLDLLLANDATLEDILARRVKVAAGTHNVWLVPLDGLRYLKESRGSPQDVADLAALGDDKEQP